MDRKRKNIPARVRWSVFQRDEFRCVYCGVARKDGANLVIDHGDPFSKGGADDPSNFVTACKECNDGKRAKEFLPKAADGEPAVGLGEEFVIRRGLAYKNHLHADWAEVFRHCCFSVDYVATLDCPSAHETVRPISRIIGEFDTFSILTLDFRCEFQSPNVGKLNVVILPNCDPGCFRERDKERMRDAAILGYKQPTLIIFGSPWHFFAAAVINRHKGCPEGFTLDGRMNRESDFFVSGWYPDENWDSLDDPRKEFDIKWESIDFRAWHMTPAEGFALAESEVQYGL